MKKPEIIDGSPVRKNIDLPQWVVDEFDEMANKEKNRFKPFVELTLERLASKHKMKKVRDLIPQNKNRWPLIK